MSMHPNPTPDGCDLATDPFGLFLLFTTQSCKFTNPKNGDTIQADQTFTMTMAIKNLETGNFVNAQKSYFAAPAQVNAQGESAISRPRLRLLPS